MNTETTIEKAEAVIEEMRELLAKLEAERAAPRRNWPEKVAAGMVFSLFDQLFMPFSHANDGVCRWKICLNDGTITELGPIEYGSTAFGYKGRAADGLRWSDPVEACANAADAHEPTGAELVGKACEFADLMSGPWSPGECAAFGQNPSYPYRKAGGAEWKYARLAR